MATESHGINSDYKRSLLAGLELFLDADIAPVVKLFGQQITPLDERRAQCLAQGMQLPGTGQLFFSRHAYQQA